VVFSIYLKKKKKTTKAKQNKTKQNKTKLTQTSEKKTSKIVDFKWWLFGDA